MPPGHCGGAAAMSGPRQPNEESAMDHVNQTFEAGTITLDGNSYVGCTFRDITFLYSGGPVEMSNCSLERFSFQFGGDLSQGLFTLYQLFGTEGMLTILRGFTEPGDGGEISLPPKA